MTKSPALTKRFLSGAIALAIGFVAISSLLATPVPVHAQPASNNGNSGVENTGATNTGTQATSNNQAAETNTPSNENAVNTSAEGPVKMLFGAAMDVLGFVAYFILKIANMLLALAGWLFNLSITVSVFQFGQILGNSEGMLAAWGVLRDIGNIILLFGFIFMGLLLILDAHHYPVKATLPKFIIFAVLLNFSLFVAEFVIDTSNAFAAAVYLESGVCEQDMSSQECAKDTRYGLSGRVMEMAGVSGIFDITSEISLMSGGATTIGLALFVTVTAVVLFAASIMLLARMVVLAILMVTSPIGFVGLAVPPLSGLARSWWSNLVNQSFFAPALLLLILVSLKLMDGVRTALNNQGGTSYESLGAVFNATGQSNPTVLLTFGLMIGLMVASLMIARKMGAVGADFAINNSSKLVGATTFGGMAMVGRRTIGAGSNRIAGSIRSSEWAQKRPGLARLAVKPFDYGQNASFDFRAAPGVKNVSKAAGLDLGKSSKHAAHGYHGVEEKMVKDREDFYKTLKPTKEQKATADVVDKQLDKVKGERRAAEQKYLDAIENARKELEAALKNKDAAARAEAENKFNFAMTQYESAQKKEGELGKIAAQQKTLEARLKAWNARAEQLKTDTYVGALEKSAHQWWNQYILQLEGHSDHEAAEKIKKGGSMSETDKALKALKSEMEKAGKKDDEHGDDHGGGDHGAAHAPAAHPPAPKGGGGHGGGDHGHGGGGHH